MNDHPLGEINDITAADQFLEGRGNGKAKSIVDNILDLDALLSADIRLAEKSARFSTNPAIEAEMEDLVAELETLVDSDGRPKSQLDASVAGSGGRSADFVSLEIDKLEDEYAASMVTVRLRQLDEDDWTAFLTKWKTTLADLPPYPPAFWEELIVKSAIRPTFTADQLREFRRKVGHPAFEAVSGAAWAVNTQSGVSVPKSSLSSAVLRQRAQG